MLNANRNIIPDTTTAPAAVVRAAPKPADITKAERAAWLKKWLPWILAALLALAIVYESRRRSSRPRGRRATISTED